MVAAMVVSVTSLVLIKNTLPRTDPGYGAEEFRIQASVMLLTVAITTAVWVTVTFLTKPVSDATLDAFYRRVRPGGPGWEAVSRRLGFGREPIPGGAMSFVNWILGIVLVYTALFGIGKIVFGQIWIGLGLLGVAAVSFVLIMGSLKRQETTEKA
jgi:solute:Na+ symporter, SSS family